MTASRWEQLEKDPELAGPWHQIFKQVQTSEPRSRPGSKPAQPNISEADIWALIEQHPETHSLILSNIEGDPVEVTDARLRAMRDDGKITLYPAGPQTRE
jgi:hypothetical protein